jgi:hypothetical protein
MYTIEELFDTRDEAVAEIRSLPGTRAPSWRYYPIQKRLWEAQRQLAEAFGAIFGWRLSKTAFGPDVLARRGVSARMTVDYWDHADCYRLNRRAAGVVAHLYAGADIDGAPAWAAANGLVAHVLPEIASWYSPHTTVVLYRPRALDRRGYDLSRFPGRRR